MKSCLEESFVPPEIESALEIEKAILYEKNISMDVDEEQVSLEIMDDGIDNNNVCPCCYGVDELGLESGRVRCRKCGMECVTNNCGNISDFSNYLISLVKMHDLDCEKGPFMFVYERHTGLIGTCQYCDQMVCL